MTTDILALIEAAELIASDLQRYHDAGVETGCEIPETRQILANWQIKLTQYLAQPQPVRLAVVAINPEILDAEGVKEMIENISDINPDKTRH